MDEIEKLRAEVAVLRAHLEDLARKLSNRLNEPELFALVKPEVPQPQPPADNEHVAEGATPFPEPGAEFVNPFVPVMPTTDPNA